MEEKSSKRLSTREKYKEEIESFTVRENSKITDNGMNHNRGCTDFLCLLVFIGTVVAMCMVSIYCYRQGQFQKIISPVDKNGNFCGHDPEYLEYPNIFFTKLQNTK